VVPVSRAQGLPIGLQIVGARGRDDLTLDVAAALEAAGCNFQRAPSPFGG
jgi:Asp-tRNA(Asn)/Glu-tRNA(Gln) amidotransferase A subunit family amidase